MALDPACQALSDKVDRLTGDIDVLQDMLSTATTSGKGPIASRIKKLNALLATTKDQLADCLVSHPSTPDAPPPQFPAITSGLSGTLIFRTTNTDFPGPFTFAPATADFVFAQGTRFNFDISNMNLPATGSIVVAPDSLASPPHGNYSYSTGSLVLIMNLQITINAVVFGIPVSTSSKLPILLSTSQHSGTTFGDLPGSPLDQSGSFIASGVGICEGGSANGVQIGVVLSGTLKPSPKPL